MDLWWYNFASMKVAIVIESIDTRRGGAETSTVQFVHRLAERGCEVHVFTTSEVPTSPAMTVHPVRVPRPARNARTSIFLRRAPVEIRRHHYDIVHSMLPLPGCDVYQPRGGTAAESIERNLALLRWRPLRQAKRIGNRFNVKRRSQLEEEQIVFAQYPRTIIAALSEYVCDQLRRHYHVDESRIRLVYNAVEVPDVSREQREADRRAIRGQFAIAEDELVLLIVAHNFRLKGVGRAVEAVARLARRHALHPKVLVVGRGHPPRHIRLAQRLGVADQFVFVGPSDRVGAFYHAADVLIHPTYYDPCSRVVLEALVSGLPPVTTRYNGAAEVIQDGTHGYVIDSPESVEDLTESIRRLADPDHRTACGREGKKLKEPLSMDRHVEEMLGVYREILDRRAHG